MGMSMEQILEGYPGMTPVKIQSAVQYYQNHREEIERDLREDDEYVDQIMSGPDVVIVQVSRIDDARSHLHPSG